LEDPVPTYSYACTQCDNRFDIVQSFTDDSLTECPECSGRLRKLFNAVGIVFKGSGFYRTDSRSSGSTVSAESKSESSSESKSDSKSSDAKAGDSKSANSEKSKSESSTKPATALAS
jgi:putative FmdB family regulatory protein